ncbi:MAG: ATP synthase subunit I [Desulfobacterales bacterium]|nr:ATP synthase subunit I [Desulfobacterales bacterium]
MTSSISQIAIAFTAGIGLGVFYFGGLWLTVRRLPTARRPALLSLLSFFGRLGVVLFGFYLVMGPRWERLLVCLLAFLGTRVVLVRLWGPGKTRA